MWVWVWVGVCRCVCVWGGGAQVGVAAPHHGHSTGEVGRVRSSLVQAAVWCTKTTLCVVQRAPSLSQHPTPPPPPPLTSSSTLMSSVL
jgi:hypothetical protein